MRPSGLLSSPLMSQRSLRVDSGLSKPSWGPSLLITQFAHNYLIAILIY